MSLLLLQGIFPNQGSNPGLPHGRWILYCLSYQGRLRPCGSFFKHVFWLRVLSSRLERCDNLKTVQHPIVGPAKPFSLCKAALGRTTPPSPVITFNDKFKGSSVTECAAQHFKNSTFLNIFLSSSPGLVYPAFYFVDTHFST